MLVPLSRAIKIMFKRFQVFPTASLGVVKNPPKVSGIGGWFNHHPFENYDLSQSGSFSYVIKNETTI